MAIPPEGLDYQQWVDNYSSGQYNTYAQGGLPGNVSQVPFQQPSQQQAQSQLHHIQTTAPAAAPTQNRYNFVQEPYASGEQGAGYDPQFAPPIPGDRPQRGMPRISRRGGPAVGYAAAPNLRIPDAPRGAYQQPQQSPHRPQQAFGVQGAAQGGESYFYSPVNADVIPGAGDQQHHSSYSFAPQYQPDSYPPTYTPSSDFTNLPSSVSTPSVGGGTDDGQLTYSSASSHAPQRPPAQQAHSSSSRHSAGSATRTTGRRGKPAAKRQREEIQDGDDSDTQSDDEQPPTLSGLNMTVNVPPPQGQNSLPGRL
ncbi:hypothetical protein TRAPUB_11573 [Trametes pubescens]|uniref:Uncharacterized protein n=1 Tax=Trametes pubescens TaxID=154538 RepID=A0A1M2VWA8_TRAPU|nr:hypothetical protein TRAPUB_11573 [Trametes pubescens]